MIRFTIPGPPFAWRRPLNRKGGGRREDPEVTAEKARIVFYARGAAGSTTYPAGPVRLDVTAVFPRPARRPAGCSVETWATGERCYAVPGTDGSNVRKLVEDALGTDRTVGWKLYSDDNQVAAGETIQVYAAVVEAPCVEIRVEALPAWEQQAGIAGRVG